MEVPETKYKSPTERSSLLTSKCQMKVLQDLTLKACSQLFKKRDCNSLVESLNQDRPDLSDFGPALAYDAADQLVGNGHLVGLLAARAPPLTAQHRQGWGWLLLVILTMITTMTVITMMMMMMITTTVTMTMKEEKLGSLGLSSNLVHH